MALWTPVAGEVPTAAQWADRVSRRVIIDCTSATRPGSPVEGMHIYETDTDKLLCYTGAAWTETGTYGAWSTYSPSWTSSGTPPAIGNGTLTGRYQRLFGRCFVIHIVLTAGSTTTFGTGQWSLSLPSVTAQSGVPLAFGTAVDAGTNTYPIIATGTGPLNLIYMTGSPVGTGLVTATAPFTFANGDSCSLTAILESTS